MDIKFLKNGKAKLFLTKQEKETFKMFLMYEYESFCRIEKTTEHENIYIRYSYLLDMSVILSILKNKSLDTIFLDDKEIILNPIQVCFIAGKSTLFSITNEVLTKIDKHFLSIRK